MNAFTLQFEEFPDNSTPRYAILSHTWGNNEVTFQDFELGREKSKIGYQKVLNICQRALSDDLRYVWVDTCCIDKTSSAELSEAINSMFSWYARSAICYAYIEDAREFDFQNDRDAEEFGKCRWFSRGWTLQELIAPSIVVFFSRNWLEFGRRQSLSKLLSKITGIDLRILENPELERILATSIAKRMSWASSRVTTRVEDMAYCLLGLFDVHIPLIYGEGEKAFVRLQEEIIRLYHDHSLLAWCKISEDYKTISLSENTSGERLLATSPSMFRFSADIVSFRPSGQTTPYTLTNRGLSIELAVRGISGDHCLALLNCYLANDLDHQLAIHTSGILESQIRVDDKIYLIPRCEIKIGNQTETFALESIYFSNPMRSMITSLTDYRHDSLFVSRSTNYKVTNVEPMIQWDSNRYLLGPPRSYSKASSNTRAFLQLEYDMSIKEKINSKLRLLVFIEYSIRVPVYDSMAWRLKRVSTVGYDLDIFDPIAWRLREISSGREISTNREALKFVPSYRNSTTIQTIEQSVRFNIVVTIQNEEILGQNMDVLKISEPAISKDMP